jgi:hypothetical protein
MTPKQGMIAAEVLVVAILLVVAIAMIAKAASR